MSLLLAAWRELETIKMLIPMVAPVGEIIHAIAKRQRI
jgi:hypothetical protein